MIKRIEHRKWNRGHNGLHHLGQPVASSILFPVFNPPDPQGSQWCIQVGPSGCRAQFVDITLKVLPQCKLLILIFSSPISMSTEGCPCTVGAPCISAWQARAARCSDEICFISRSNPKQPPAMGLKPLHCMMLDGSLLF